MWYLSHPQLRKEMEYMSSYSAENKAMLDFQIRTIMKGVRFSERPRANMLILPGCELGQFHDDHHLQERYREGIMYSYVTALNQESCWFILKDRGCGFHGKVSNNVFWSAIVNSANFALKQRQHDYDLYKRDEEENDTRAMSRSSPVL